MSGPKTKPKPPGPKRPLVSPQEQDFIRWMEELELPSDENAPAKPQPHRKPKK